MESCQQTTTTRMNRIRRKDREKNSSQIWHGPQSINCKFSDHIANVSTAWNLFIKNKIEKKNKKKMQFFIAKSIFLVFSIPDR